MSRHHPSPKRLVVGLVSLAALAGCSSVLPQTTPFTPVVDTFEGKYIETISADIQAARGPEQDGFGTKALNDLQISQGLATMDIEGLVDAPEMLSYLRDILARVVGVYPYDKPAIEIFIDASARGTAQATPDAEIYVSLGFLEKVETEGQLAMVLAHEAAHVLLNHFSRQDYIDAQRKAVTAGAGIGILASAVANTDIDKGYNGEVQVKTDTQDTAEKTAKLQTSSWLINRVSDHVVNNLWSRKQEEAADLLAADLLIKSGYNPRAERRSVSASHGIARRGGADLSRLSRQAAARSRLSRACATATARLNSPGNTLKPREQRLRRRLRQGSLAQDGSSTHIDPAERQERMNTYRKARFTRSVKFSKEATRRPNVPNYKSAKELGCRTRPCSPVTAPPTRRPRR